MTFVSKRKSLVNFLEFSVKIFSFFVQLTFDFNKTAFVQFNIKLLPLNPINFVRFWLTSNWKTSRAFDELFGLDSTKKKKNANKFQIIKIYFKIFTFVFKMKPTPLTSILTFYQIFPMNFTFNFFRRRWKSLGFPLSSICIRFLTRLGILLPIKTLLLNVQRFLIQIFPPFFPRIR